MNNQNRVNRLNALYKKAQLQPLNAAELAERDQLRREYLAMIRGQVKASLEQFERPGGAAPVSSPHEHECGENCGCGRPH